MEKKSTLLRARAHFISLVVSGDIALQGAPRAQLIEILRSHNLPSLSSRTDAEGFEYLLGTNVSAFTEERMEALTKEVERLAGEITKLRALQPPDMWLQEIEILELAFAEYTSRLEKRHREDGNANDRRSASARFVASAKRLSMSSSDAAPKKRLKKT